MSSIMVHEKRMGLWREGVLFETRQFYKKLRWEMDKYPLFWSFSSNGELLGRVTDLRREDNVVTGLVTLDTAYQSIVNLDEVEIGGYFTSIEMHQATEEEMLAVETDKPFKVIDDGVLRSLSLMIPSGFPKFAVS